MTPYEERDDLKGWDFQNPKQNPGYDKTYDLPSDETDVSDTTFESDGSDYDSDATIIYTPPEQESEKTISGEQPVPEIVDLTDTPNVMGTPPQVVQIVDVVEVCSNKK